MIYQTPVFAFKGLEKNVLFNWRPKYKGCYSVTLSYIALFNGRRIDSVSSVRVNVK